VTVVSVLDRALRVPNSAAFYAFLTNFQSIASHQGPSGTRLKNRLSAGPVTALCSSGTEILGEGAAGGF